MEEISWGQRIFNIQTPAFLAARNLQEEINIHNLEYGRTHALFHVATLFIAFCLVYFLIIPVAAASSKKANHLLNRIGIPLVPLHMGLLFLLNWFSRPISLHPMFGDFLYPLEEIREANWAVLFLCFSAKEYFKLTKDSGSSHIDITRTSASQP